MKHYGFNFETFYHLELESLYEICQFIREDKAIISPDYDVLIRGCIIPFFRNATNAPRKTTKNEIVRLALITTAERLNISLENPEEVETEYVARVTRHHIQKLITQKLDELAPKEKNEILRLAQQELSIKVTKQTIAHFNEVIGKSNRFAPYLETLPGLQSLSSAFQTTFSQLSLEAPSLPVILFSLIGWGITGISFIGKAPQTIYNWITGKQEQKLVLVVATLLLAIGESPYEFFNLPSDASPTQVKKTYQAVLQVYHPDKIAHLNKLLPEWVEQDFADKTLRCIDAKEKFERVFQQELDG